MANRSKKIVLSARVEPYLRDGLELHARMKNKKIVEALEDLIEKAVEDIYIDNPFKRWLERKGGYVNDQISLSTLLALVWDKDPVVYNLRLARLGNQFLSETIFLACSEVWQSKYFVGEDDVFDYTRVTLGLEDSLFSRRINLDLVRSEWETLISYANFSLSNKPMIISYEQYKQMLPSNS